MASQIEVSSEETGDVLALDASVNAATLIECDTCGCECNRYDVIRGMCRNCTDRYRPKDYDAGEIFSQPNYAGL